MKRCCIGERLNALCPAHVVAREPRASLISGHLSVGLPGFPRAFLGSNPQARAAAWLARSLQYSGCPCHVF